MGQIPMAVMSIFVIVMLGACFLLFGAQYGAEKGQYDDIRRYVVDQVDKEGAITPSVLSNIQQAVNATGLEFSHFDFSGSTTVPVPLFEVARVEIRYSSEIENKSAEELGALASDEYHDVLFVTRTGR